MARQSLRAGKSGQTVLERLVHRQINPIDLHSLLARRYTPTPLVSEFSQAPPSLLRIPVECRVRAMADFQTHITTSTIIGIGYGVAGYFGMGLPIQTCALAAGLCGASGMLPDLDSDSGVPVRETTTLAAAIAPMLMMERFARLGWSHETMTVVGGAVYLVIRFGVSEIFKRYTVHRGMWHSLPAAAVAGLLAFLVCSCDDEALRLYKALAVVTGFLSHLVLDELWSIDILMGRIRFKKSFGTALKLWSDSWWANLSTYAKLIALSALAFYDPLLMENLDQRRTQAEQIASELLEKSQQEAQQLWQQSQESPPILR